jgi:hypothetical protein
MSLHVGVDTPDTIEERHHGSAGILRIRVTAW